MTLIKNHFLKFVVGAVTILALSTMLSDTASASRYAVAYGEFIVSCGTTPGDICPTG